MSYTPETDFDFTGKENYTPDSDFDFSDTEEQPHNLSFDQAWGLASPHFDDHPIDQAWSLRAPTFRNQLIDAAWRLSAPVFNSRPFDAGWALAAPTFANAQADQAWALVAPVFADRPHDLQWALVAPAGGDIGFSQQWRLEASAVWTRVISSTAYIFAIEQGAARDEIPMANFSGQFRSGSPSYLQVSIPDAGTHASAIQAYAALDNVEMVIEAGYLYSDGDYQTQEIARVSLRNIRYDYGSRSSSVSLDGTDTRTNHSPKAVTLSGSSYLNIDTDGRLRYRVRPDFSVRPGDTVTVDGDTFTAGEISWQVNSTSATMEVAG